MPLLDFLWLGLLSSVSPLLQSPLPKFSAIIINNVNNGYNEGDDSDDNNLFSRYLTSIQRDTNDEGEESLLNPA